MNCQERPAIPVEIEFPTGCKVFFLGAGAYGVPAQVAGHKGSELSINIVVSHGYHSRRARAEKAFFSSSLPTRRRTPLSANGW